MPKSICTTGSPILSSLTDLTKNSSDTSLWRRRRVCNTCRPNNWVSETIANLSGSTAPRSIGAMVKAIAVLCASSMFARKSLNPETLCKLKRFCNSSDKISRRPAVSATNNIGLANCSRNAISLCSGSASLWSTVKSGGVSTNALIAPTLVSSIGCSLVIMRGYWAIFSLKICSARYKSCGATIGFSISCLRSL